MRGRAFKIAYQLHYHYWGSWSLDRWLCGLAFGLAGLLFFLRLVRGRTSGGPVLWLPVVPLFLGLALLAFGGYAANRSYIFFRPQRTAPPPGRALRPVDKILIWATGRFEVNGNVHFFAHLLAYWRTFASREHAVMAMVHGTRYLFLGAMPEGDVGMWYIFWYPEKMAELTPGLVVFGTLRRPGLRVRYDTPDLGEEQRRRLPFWQRGRKFSRRETVYLAFDDESSREHVWADLLADAQPALA